MVARDLFTKLTALYMILIGLGVLATQLRDFNFWTFLLGALAPIAIGYLLLATEIVFDLATAEQRRRQSVSK